MHECVDIAEAARGVEVRGQLDEDQESAEKSGGASNVASLVLPSSVGPQSGNSVQCPWEGDEAERMSMSQPSEQSFISALTEEGAEDNDALLAAARSRLAVLDTSKNQRCGLTFVNGPQLKLRKTRRRSMRQYACSVWALSERASSPIPICVL
jgi:hypothetical protein